MSDTSSPAPGDLDTPDTLVCGKIVLPKSDWVTIEEARTLLMGPHCTQPVPQATVYAWTNRGVRGKVLVSIPFGGRRILERAAVLAFRRHLLGLPEEPTEKDPGWHSMLPDVGNREGTQA